MRKLTTVSARMDQTLKESAEEIFAKLGITHSQVINALYSLTVLRGGVPFELKLRDDETTNVLMNSNLMGQIIDSLKSFMSEDMHVHEGEINEETRVHRQDSRGVRTSKVGE